MKVTRFSFNMFEVNTYFLYDPETREAAIVDPGMISSKERDALDRYAEGFDVKQLINTHLHLDHIFGDEYVRTRYGVPVRASKEDEFFALSLDSQIRSFRLPVEAQPISVDEPLVNGDIIKIGKEELHVIAVPGHSPGSIALYCPSSKFVITGDALFKGSIGRTDLAKGDYKTLARSIREKLFTLPDDTLVLPGHGPSTTIGEERQFNRYV